jgi:hypothetical protein
MDHPSGDNAKGFDEPLQADFRTVFAAELKRIRQSRKNRNPNDITPPVDEANPAETAKAMELVGVSFSGGGIRSATFNLGVLQAMARAGLLRHVDYLSTVSGGGYIGAWLNAMIHRADDDAPDGTSGMDQIEPGLNPDNPEPPSRLPQDAISYLRAYSNYLTPKMSAMSADTWAMASIWFRNTVLNLGILVAGIAALMLAARSFGMWALVGKPSESGIFLGSLSVAFLAISTIFLGLNVGEKLSTRWRRDLPVIFLVVAPAVVASTLITALMRHQQFPLDTNWIFIAGAILSVMFLAFQSIAGFWGCFLRQHDDLPAAPFWAALIQVGIAALSGLVTASLFHVVGTLTNSWKDTIYFEWLMLTVGPPMALTALAFGVIANVGLLGRDIPDGVREWIGRTGAWMMTCNAGWLLFFGAAIYGPLWLQEAWGWAQYAVTGTWVLGTLCSILAAKSAKTGQGSDKGDSSTAGVLDTVAKIGPYVFMGGFVVVISLAVHEIVSTPSISQATAAAGNAVVQVNESNTKVDVSIDSKSDTADLASIQQQYWEEMDSQEFFAVPGDPWYKGTVTMLLLCAGIALLMSWRVDINEFSLNHFYKNRLVRCYLGASRFRDERLPDPFTKFDRRDDVRLNELDNEKFSGPFPIINATLNLSSGRNLAWQERQGASFIFTPIYSGYDTGSDRNAAGVSRRVRVQENMDLPAYYPTYLVAKTDEGGIMMGTAVSISGAAASPNQGFHTSTAVAFLMTVFDVRLGWWLGNPASKKAEASGPTFGLPFTLAELFGIATASSKYVDLSDGGHFENLGLYELIRRRCKYIIVCDAEQDEELQFGGITTAVRMCRTDFGTQIDFRGQGLDRIERKDDNKPENFSANHFAIADITYPGGQTGKLIYLKSSLTGDEPADILGYHARVSLFPHESTADQWFDESQFESYRCLGQHIAEDIFRFGAQGKKIAVDGKDAYFSVF